ncbi:MAG: tRNA (adenosine(37)-N6)-threonylcarbamoyltransferase complex dimerization subunit type 1 TsaB [Patescibacteria group bacterium]
MFLLLDTTAEHGATVALVDQSGKVTSTRRVNGVFAHAEKLLVATEGLLRATRLSPRRLSGIAVVRGPGGFTAVRMGVVTANVLAYALGVLLVGVRTADEPLAALARRAAEQLRHHASRRPVVPLYSSPPNITPPKKKPLR